jgi:photosynthetic reaction center cytochrome c subunit
MIKTSRKTYLAATGLATALALTFVGAHAQQAGAPPMGPGQAPGGQGAAMAGKKAPEVYKNIQVLKDIDADQLIPTMQFIAASLGVDCDFCHVQGAREKDDKPEKTTARHMMLMVFAINKDNFGGRQQVTCYSCHRGSNDPVAVPIIPDVEPVRMEAGRGGPGGPGSAGGGAAAAPPALPTVDQIADKYLQAVGGADAVAKITTRVEKGNQIVNGNSTPIELYTKAPDKRISIAHGARGDSITAFDGTEGWMTGRGGAQPMAPAQSLNAKVDAIFSLPTELKQAFPRLRVFRADKIGDRDVYVVVSQGPPPVRLFFDEQTGLLVRLIRYTDTPLGRMPEAQIDYADYRDSDGVKIPYRWTVARLNGGRFTIQIDSVQDNVPVDDAKFAMPATPAVGGGRTQ